MFIIWVHDVTDVGRYTGILYVNHGTSGRLTVQ